MIFCGPRIPPAGLERFQVYDVTQSEEFLRRNAELTAEGALFAAMRAQERALMDCACLVVGWGRIGRALTERLVALGARVTVASRSERGMRLAQSRGADAVETARLAEALPGKKLVFSTPPFPVLCGEALKSVDPDACLIDLASPPYGVDVEAAHRMGLRAWREPGLPGRYCPESAARALAKRSTKFVKEAGKMTDLQGARIGCAMTGSFCTFSKAFAAFEALRAAGAELYPIMSNNAYALDTRFRQRSGHAGATGGDMRAQNLA